MPEVQSVYFHGQPGSPEELGLVASLDGAAAAWLFAPDRARDRPDLDLDDYFEHLAQAIARRFPSGPLRLIGFSLGGFVALEAALRLNQLASGREIALDLISAAAPLTCGDFLGDMAGGPVFAMARDRRRGFRWLTRAQGAIARLAPGMLFAGMFANAAGEDAALARDPAFRARVQGMLRHSLSGGAKGYDREVLGYVAWDATRLGLVQAPVTLWHGTADNWTPPAMVRALEAALPNVRASRIFPGLSHYSTLRAALPQILGV